jgi:hypothetical protein
MEINNNLPVCSKFEPESFPLLTAHCAFNFKIIREIAKVTAVSYFTVNTFFLHFFFLSSVVFSFFLSLDSIFGFLVTVVTGLVTVYYRTSGGQQYSKIDTQFTF